MFHFTLPYHCPLSKEFRSRTQAEAVATEEPCFLACSPVFLLPTRTTACTLASSSHISHPKTKALQVCIQPFSQLRSLLRYVWVYVKLIKTKQNKKIQHITHCFGYYVYFSVSPIYKHRVSYHLFVYFQFLFICFVCFLFVCFLWKQGIM